MQHSNRALRSVYLDEARLSTTRTVWVAPSGIAAIAHLSRPTAYKLWSAIFFLTVALGCVGGLLSGCGGSGSSSSNQPTTTPTAATPIFSPAAGTYAAPQTVTISDTTMAATIYFTTDGSTPTASSTKYAGAITVSATETIEAVAVASGYNTSAVASAAYSINIPVAATPMFSPSGGTYTAPQTVTISDATTGATIYYTTDGSVPTVNSTPYTGPLTVSSTETLSAIAVASGYTNSAVATATYSINIPVSATPTFSPTGGTYSAPQTVTISDTTMGATIYYTTDGSTPTASSIKYTGTIMVLATETIEAIAVASGYANSAVATAAYTINLPAATRPTLSPAGGTYTGSQTVTISVMTTGATIYYTMDGSTPTTNSTQYGEPITVSSTETIQAIAAANGYTNSAVTTAAYTIVPGGPAAQIMFPIQFIPSAFGGGGILINPAGIAPGEPANADPQLFPQFPLNNPADPSGEFSWVTTFVGGAAITQSSTTEIVPTYFVDMEPGGAKLFSATTTTTANPVPGVAPGMIGQVVSSSALPYTANTDGSYPATFLVNTGSGIVSGAGNNAAASYTPVSGAGVLGTTVALTSPNPPASNVSSLTVDLNDNVGVVNGTGADAVLSIFDPAGTWQLSGPSGMVSPNAMMGTTASVIPADGSTAVNLATSYLGPGILFYSQAASVGVNVGFEYMQPGATGAAPTVVDGVVSNPAGVPFGLVQTFIAGTGPASANPSSILFADQAAGAAGSDLAIYQFDIDYSSGTPVFTQTGSANIPGNGGANTTISIAQNAYAVFVASSAGTGAYFLPKLTGGVNDFGAPVQIWAIPNVVSLQVDADGHIEAENASGTAAAGFGPAGEGWVAFTGGVPVLVNPSIGTVDIGIGTTP